ncbi:MAG: hypothetical protein U0271_40515 [Polyangiaceae bacterium]
MDRWIRFLGVVLSVGSVALSGCGASRPSAPVGGGGQSLDTFAALPDNPHEEAKPAPKALRAEWRAYLTHQRELQLQRLSVYTEARQYALNLDQPGLRFVWRDEAGRLCAMANLVFQSGKTELVEKVAREENELQLASVQSGPLFDWMLESGLLQEEVQLIQFPDFTRRPPGEGVKVGVAPAQPGLELAKRTEWEIRRKHDHLVLVLERLQMDSEGSVESALDRLGDKLFEAPPVG